MAPLAQLGARLNDSSFQNSGQGTAGVSPLGAGKIPSSSNWVHRSARASISLGIQQLRQPPPQLTVEPVENPADAVGLLLAQRLAEPSPQHRAQLVRHMKRQPVVHPVTVPAGHGGDVGALAVGVVDDHVEHCHLAQRRRVLVGQDEPPPVLALLNV